MKRIVIIFILILLLSLACTLGGLVNQDGIEAVATVVSPTEMKRFCGDGVCDGPENAENCSQDCATVPLITEVPTVPSPVQGDAIPAVLYLGIMVHLEGWNDHMDQESFKKHALLIREYASLFETYGAKLTWESKEVTDASLKWGDHVLLEMEQRGHGVGVHADIGGQKNYACERFTRELKAEKEQLESLGVTVRHVSGNVSQCDWVTATADAGYVFTSGQVAYAVMSLPPEDRPAEYRDCKNPAMCHDTFPVDLADRLHPWRMNSGVDWLTHNPDGRLVILPSSGGLVCMEEEANGQKACGEFTQADIDAFLRELEQAVALSQPGEVNIYYVSWSLGKPLDKQLLERWLQAIEPFVVSGQVEWKTLPEMYEAYVAWESGF